MPPAQRLSPLMKSWIVTANDPHPVLSESPKPDPAAGQILVRVAACGLNFADLLMLEGRYQDTPARPYVPGLEFAGEVAGFGTGVTAQSTGLKLGQPVAAFGGQGGLAQFACLPVARVLPLPHSMTMAQAAGFQIAYGTSHLALRRAALCPGETLVVTGASGGVGLTAVELGKRLGARVIAIARGQAKQEVARAAGADETLDSDMPDLRGALKSCGGVDVIYDAVGGDLFDPCLRALRPEGRYLVIGFASGSIPKFPANLLLVKNISVIGFYWGGYLAFRPAALAQSLAELLALHEQSPLRLHISHQLPFEAFPEGLDLLKTRRATGKVVINLPQ